MGKEFWEFKNINEDEGELLLYGEIVSEKPWWDFDNESASQKKFMEDLKSLGTKSKITVRINSIGGDVFAAHAMYTNLKINPASIEVIVDGLAASAATIVAMAGDTIKMPSNAMMMIHNPLTLLFGMYNAQDLEKASDTLEHIKLSIIAAYKARTGKTEKELSKLMDADTWMTAAEAKEMGFADEVLFADDSAVMVGNFLVINNISHDLSKFSSRPPMEQFKISSLEPKPVIIEKEGEHEMTLEGMKNKYPDLVKSIEDAAKLAGAASERERIKSIDAICHAVTPEMLQEAKYGEEPITAEALAVKVVASMNEQGSNYLTALKSDQEKSGIEKIEGSGTGTVDVSSTAKAESILNIQAAIEKASKRGGRN